MFATDFSGMDTAAFAIEEFAPPFPVHHVFASDLGHIYQRIGFQICDIIISTEISVIQYERAQESCKNCVKKPNQENKPPVSTAQVDSESPGHGYLCMCMAYDSSPMAWTFS